MFNIIQRPLEIIDELFSCRKFDADNIDSFDISSIGEQALFRKFLLQTGLGNIPHISLDADVNSIANRSLCRYRGLVQDVLNPEIYCGVHPRSGALLKYRDEITDDSNQAFSNAQLDERHSYICAAVPGESFWVNDIHGQTNGICERSKRSGSFDSNMESDRPSKMSRQVVNGGQLKSNDTCSVAIDMEHTISQNEAVTTLINRFNVLVYDSTDNDGSDSSLKLNDMIEIVGVLEKWSHTEENASTSEHTRTMLPTIEQQLLGLDAMEDWDDNMRQESIPPYHRIHAILIRKVGSSYPLIYDMSIADVRKCGVHSTRLQPTSWLDTHRTNDFHDADEVVNTVFERVVGPCVSSGADAAVALAAEATIDVSDESAIELQGLLLSGYGHALDLLSGALGGDHAAAIAAEYISLALLSRLYCRPGSQTDEESKAASGNTCYSSSEGISMVGSLAIHISGFDSHQDPRIAALREVLQWIVPRCCELKTDMNSLHASNCSLLPSRNYEDDRIEVSPLQVAQGTVLLLNETQESSVMEAITEADKAKIDASVKAIRSVIVKQILPVRFMYYEVSIPMDSPIIVLSTSSFSNGVCCGPASNSSNSMDSDEHDDDQEVEPTMIHISVSPLMEVQSAKIASWLQLYQRASPRILHSMQMWWAVNRLRSGTMSNQVVQLAESDFVNKRQEYLAQRDNKLPISNSMPFQQHNSSQLSSHDGVQQRLVTAEDLQRWIAIARLICVANGEDEISEKHWERMKILDQARLAHR